MQGSLEILICPNCRCLLKSVGTSLVCMNNHCFDVSKEGYINLLLPNMKKSKFPGDDKIMIDARQLYLSKGYYQPLRDMIDKILEQYSGGIILDAGCGTGYYTENIDVNKFDVLGVDISKYAVRIASKNNKQNLYVVASMFSLPIVNNSIDIIFNIFAPKPQDEFKRVLKDKGIIIEVVPGKDHLKELKSIIYKDDFLENKEKYAFGDFSIEHTQRLLYEKQIKDNTNIVNLLKMTPYWYNGGEKNIKQIEKTQFNKITFDFIINIWRKHGNISIC